MAAAIAIVKDLRRSVVGAREGLMALRTSIASWPRVTRKLARAKKYALAAMDNLVREMDTMQDITLQVESLMEGLLSHEDPQGRILTN